MCCPLAIAALTVATWGESAGLRATRTMRHDVLRRVRWANVSLACAVLIALATLVIWPLLSPAPPALPPDPPRPLVGGEPSEGATARGSGKKGGDVSAGREKRGSG